MNIIECNNITKNFGTVTAVKNLNLTIHEGEAYALLGHNGAGKTTTLRLLLGLLKPSMGRISVFGLDPIKNGQEVRSLCGVLSEDTGLYEPLTVYENLIYFADLYGMRRSDANSRIDQLLEQFHLSEKKYTVVKDFSTGMKQKTALIRALLHHPKLLILDEPTSGLDPVTTIDLRTILTDLVHKDNTTIIMTTHNLDQVQKLCDRISIFNQGQVIFTDSLAHLKDSSEYEENGQFSLEKLYLDIDAKEARQ